MDTTAEKGVYDVKDREAGVSNTEAIRKVLLGLASGDRLYSEQISTEWIGESRVLGLAPDLLVMHRSMFFHPMNAKLKLGYPPFETQEEMDRWQALYDIADDKFINFIGSVGTVHPHTKFLIYSRGTDKRWQDSNFRTNMWPQLIESRFPRLKGRITTMLIQGEFIQGEFQGTFKMKENADEMRRLVRVLLGLPK
jgi:hypothetical protein